MAVIDIKEGYTGVVASGDDSVRRCTRVFTVTTDDPTDRGLFTWPLTDGVVTIDAPGTDHPDDGDYYSGVPAVTKKGPGFFAVKVPYQTPNPFGGGAQTPYDDPLSMPAEISWEDAERTEKYDMDLTGAAVANTLGESFDPPPTRQVSDPVLVIERNEAAFDPSIKLLYQDTVATTVFYGAAIGRAKLSKIKARSINASTPYWRTYYAIHFRFNIPDDVPDAFAWWRYMLNQGLTYMDAAGNQQDTSNGQLVALNADGTIADKAFPYWLSFQEYENQNWSGLGL